MALSPAAGTRRAGFSLIELMVSLLIIGILAAIATPMFMAYQLRSKSAEAETNLRGIQLAQQGYFAEYAVHVTIAPEPAAIPGNQAARFDAAGSGFARIGFDPEGNVYFSYGVLATADESGYTADAGADIDGDGIVQFWGYAKPDAAGAVAAGQVGCNAAALVPLEIGPCSPGAGRSIF